MNLIRQHPVVPTLVVGIVLMVVLTIVFDALVSAENPGHALRHVAQAAFFGTIGAAAGWFWPPPEDSRKWSRRLVIGGCALVAVSFVRSDHRPSVGAELNTLQKVRHSVGR